MVNNEEYSIILPARIVTYYPINQTADIQICVERIYNDSNDIGRVEARRPIESVPVHTPSGGGWAMTMPIKTGDSCLVFFSQVGYDHWLYEDKDVAGTLANMPKPWLKRQFSEDDGYALVGLNTLPRAITNYSAVDSQWRNVDSTQIIDLREDLSIVITSPTSLTINAPTVTVNATDVVVTASGSTLITCPDNTIDGPLDVTGVITAPSMVANGIILETHDHAGDGGTGSGPSTSGPRNV